ncbi:MAG: hypothetical protein FJ164_10270 [Gammaproteobacteria bacterium]|nr:hypothetical protein [Gammaproteobacteria bacterium]
MRALVDRKVDSGIAHGGTLLAFADATIGTDSQVLNSARDDLKRALSPGALVQAAAIVANFAMNDRAANALGIVLEAMFVRGSADFRQMLGIDRYPSASNTLRD